MSCICVVSGGVEEGPAFRWVDVTVATDACQYGTELLGTDACQYGYMVRCIQHEQMLARGVDPSPGPAAAPAAAAPAAAATLLPTSPQPLGPSESEEEDGDGQ